MRLEFFNDPNAAHEIDKVRWTILIGKEGDRVRVTEQPKMEMLFSGVNAGLLFPVSPIAERSMEPNEIELTVRTTYIKGETDELDWDSLTQKIRESGTNRATQVLLYSDEVVDFCDAISLELAQRGECRLVEFLLGDEVIANYLSSGERDWSYEFYNQEFDAYLNQHQVQLQ